MILRKLMRRLRILNRSCSITSSTKVSDSQINGTCIVKILCSCSQGATWLEACCRTGSPLGHSYSGVQHCSSFLRRLQEWDRPRQHSPGTGMYSSAPHLLLSAAHSLCSVITSVPTLSVFYQGRRTRSSSLAKISVRTIPSFIIGCMLINLGRHQLDRSWWQCVFLDIQRLVFFSSGKWK